jgi:hypothetical protein
MTTTLYFRVHPSIIVPCHSRVCALPWTCVSSARARKGSDDDDDEESPAKGAKGGKGDKGKGKDDPRGKKNDPKGRGRRDADSEESDDNGKKDGSLWARCYCTRDAISF